MRSHPSRLVSTLVACALACAPALAAGGAAGVALAVAPGVALADGTVIGGAQIGEPGFVVNGGPGIPVLPATTATSFVIADADTGAVLASHNAHAKLAPASTLKTLTAVTLLDLVNPNTPLVATSDAPAVDGTKAGIVAGTAYTADNLFTAMLMMSANDAAVALADVNGGLAPTLAEMNAEAAHLQADDTVAKTPDGLDAPGQSSSAYDLALIFRAGLAMPQFRHYLALKSALFPAPGGKSFQIQTHDKLLLDYPGMIGGKNGYTVAADASYVGAATRNGHTIIVSLMRDQPDFWNEAKALLDWGFAADGLVRPVGQLVGVAVPAASASPTVQGQTFTSSAAPLAGAAAQTPAQSTSTASNSGAGRRAAGTAGSHASGSGSGVHITGVLTWTAVSLGGLFFIAAVVQLAARRRPTSDAKYLEGLSRLAASQEFSDRS